jgi:hypothetical protein
MSATNPLQQELETYAAHKAELVSKAAGKYVLIKGKKIIDIFENQADAIAAGYKQFGNVPFLVKQIQEIETPVNFYSFKLVV